MIVWGVYNVSSTCIRSFSNRPKPIRNASVMSIYVTTPVHRSAGLQSLSISKTVISNRIRHRLNNNDQVDGQKTGSWAGDRYGEGRRIGRGSSARWHGQYYWRGKLPITRHG